MTRSNYRTSIGILIDLLEIIKEHNPIGSKIVMCANISWCEIKDYLDQALTRELIIKERNDTGYNSFNYHITQKGRDFLNMMINLENTLLNEYQLSIKHNKRSK